MSRRYARRLAEIQPFKVMRLLARANELEREGHRVIHMEVGEPDFPTPMPISRGGEAALSAGHTRYTPAEGISELREAIARYYAEDYGVDIDPRRVIVTAGGSGALLLTSALLLNAGEGRWMPDPGYPCNRHFLKSFHGEGQLVPVTPDDGYQLDGLLLDRYWQPNTRGALLGSPANPTGAMVSREKLSSIKATLDRRRGFLIMDEIYHGLTYSPERVFAALEVDESAFVLNSFSKYFGMTGWRLGWLIVPDDARGEVEKLAQNLFICPSSIAQYAALEAFTPAAREIMEAQREEFRTRRDYMVPALRELGFTVAGMPEGAFYVYAKLPAGVGDSEEFCERLLEQHYVAITPGTDFGFYLAREHVRFSYARKLSVLEEGVERIAGALRI
ncbi:MAG: pyridoxal phosphate-dependent aminotransferase [Pseudomonadales bacterium]|nr:pyridoxal phosphate-dependent aminotransferase [Pseudomonadales bacterium]